MSTRADLLVRQAALYTKAGFTVPAGLLAQLAQNPQGSVRAGAHKGAYALLPGARGTTPANTQPARHGVTNVVNSVASFGLDEFGHAAHAFPSQAPDVNSNAVVADAATVAPMPFAPGSIGDTHSPISPTISGSDQLKHEHAQSDHQTDQVKHTAAMDAMFSNQTPLVQSLLGKMPLADALRIQQLIDNWDGPKHHPDAVTHALFAAITKSPKATPDHIASLAHKHLLEKGNPMAAGMAPGMAPRPSGSMA